MFAVAALAACTTEQTIVAPQNEAIGFDTFVDNSTRANDITTANIADFGVYGTVTKDNNSALIFDNTKVTKSGDAFVYSPAQYWIAAAQYDFLAFAPYQNGEGATWTYDPTKGTFSFNNATAEADQDVVYAYQAKTTEDKLTAKPEAVKFTFKHILSKVAFSFTNTFTDGNTSLSVYNVKINNTAETGTMAIADDGVDAAWNGVGDLVVPFGDQATAVNTLQAKAIDKDNRTLNLAHHYVIPAQRAYNITFSVDLYQAGVYLATYNHTIESTINFAKNGNYVLSVKLAPESIDPENELYPIEFTVNEVEDWRDNGSVALTEPVEVATADALKAAIAAGENVKLTANIALTESVLVKDVTSVIDLNGFNLVAASTDAIVVEGANLTINGNGDVKAATDDKSSANALWVKYGNVVINGGNYYVGADNAVRNDCIYLGAASLKADAANYVSSITINGGTFETKVYEADQYWVLNVQDDFYRAGSDIVVYGGSYKNFNPANNLSEGAGTNFVAPGKTVEQNGDWYIVK